MKTKSTKAFRLIFAFMLGVSSWTCAQEPLTELHSKSLAITHVTVIDTTGGAAQFDMAVVITGDRITAIGKTENVTLPKDIQQIDATGKFLIPGLWDMHVHWNRQRYLPLFTVNGVTGIRIMWGSSALLDWRKASAAGTSHGPRLIFAGAIVDGPIPRWPGSTAAGTPGDGREAVRRTKAEGYDLVKIYERLPRDVFFAIANESKLQGLSFAGHVPFSVSAAEASDAGQNSMEHLYGILLACSSKEQELMRELATARKDIANPDRAILRRVEEQTIRTYDATKAAALFAKFKANGTWQDPTLTVLQSMAHLDDPNRANDTRLKFMPLAVRQRWQTLARNPTNDFRLKDWTLDDFAQRRKMFQRELELVREMHRARVGILAGTDVSNPFCFPGFSLHDELQLLVQAGLSPLEALQTATLNPAKYLNRLRDLGTVEQGKLADLVLLDANPLSDIRNTQKIAAVVANGKLLTREILQKMLDDVEKAAQGN